MHFSLTSAAHHEKLCCMRATITISEDLLKKTQKIVGKSGYSEAIVTSLADYVAMKERFAALQLLFSKKTTHSIPKIKKQRKSRTWVATSS